MQLRSGRTLQVPDKFFAVLDEDTNRWPNEQQAYQLSIKTSDSKKFVEHLRWLRSYMVEKTDRTNREVKATRLVAMAIAQSLMNVVDNYWVHTISYQNLSKILIQKFEEYDGPEIQEFDMKEYVDTFKNFMSRR
jgi:hypothetical protein